MKNIQALMCLCLIAGGALTIIGRQGQPKSRSYSVSTSTRNPDSTRNQAQVEVKEDRFSGAKTVTLKPQVILDSPDHQLEMSAEAKVGGTVGTGITDLDQKVQIKFTSLSKSGINFGDRELHFIVDGKPVKIGKLAESVPYANDLPNKPGLKVGGRLYAVFPLSQMRQIARGKVVEMRLGTIETTLDPKLLRNLSDFIAATSDR